MKMSLEHLSDQVYSPAEDTFLLLKAAQAEARQEDRVLEMGCGSGFICEKLAERVKGILATDINPHAVRAAKAKGIEVVRADMFRGVKGRFDLVLFNAPYLPTLAEERAGGWIDYALDGGVSGRETVERFLRDLPDHLLPCGRALLLISSLTGPEVVGDMAKAAGLKAEVAARERCFFEQLYVLKLEVANCSI
jgi:release factor glutamine methyltransferase